tara:strand:+ start:377 stop:616 length:240 start_codon:yes stop_codon:yes gene_type:complete
LEGVLVLVGFVEELFSDLLFTRLSPFVTLEKAASSILLLVLDVRLDPEERLIGLSEFNPLDDAIEESEVTFFLRLDLEV